MERGEPTERVEPAERVEPTERVEPVETPAPADLIAALLPSAAQLRDVGLPTLVIGFFALAVFVASAARFIR